METTAKRLNRWTDDPVLDDAGKPRVAEIVESDRTLLRLFDRYRYLGTDFIEAFTKRNRVSLQARLNLLVRQPNKYLYRPEEQQLFPNENYRDQLYGRTERGDKTVSWLAKERFGNKRHFPHSVMINDTIASLELFAPGMIWREQIPQATNRITVSIEHRNADGEVLRKTYDYENDSHGPFGIRLDNGMARFLSLEAEHDSVADRDTLDQSSFLRKFLSIQQIARKKLYEIEWGIPHLLSLVVCKDQDAIDLRKAIIMRETKGAGCSYILFRVVPSRQAIRRSLKPMHDLYDGPWQRAGHPDFHLNQP